MKAILIALLVLCSFNQNDKSDFLQMCYLPPMTERIALAKKAEMIDSIVAKYKVEHDLAAKVVTFAIKYEQKTFPKAKDIVAIVGIESSFNPAAKSKLKRDPAEGLTQIRPAAWSHKFKREELTSIEGQIKHGSLILAHNYKVLEDKVGAIGAYNIGLRNYQEGKYKDAASRYLAKYSKEVVAYQVIEARYAK